MAGFGLGLFRFVSAGFWLDSVGTAWAGLLQGLGFVGSGWAELELGWAVQLGHRWAVGVDWVWLDTVKGVYVCGGRGRGEAKSRIKGDIDGAGVKTQM